MSNEVEFNWDKDNLNHLARHNISRAEAEEVILNGFAEIDFQVVDVEERYLVVGLKSEESQYWIMKGS